MSLLLSEKDILLSLLNKYKKISNNSNNSSYVKYNFIIELVNNSNLSLLFNFTYKDKIDNQHRIPLITFDKKKNFDVNVIYFLIKDEFKNDIDSLIIYQNNNVSTIYNGVIIDMNAYNIVCYPEKNYIYSKFSTFKKYENEDILFEYDIFKLYDGELVNLYYNKKWILSNKNEINLKNKVLDKSNCETVESFFYKMLDEKKIDINLLDRANTYMFYLINSNYNLSNQKNKIKYVSCNNFYNKADDNNILSTGEDSIKIKQLYSIYGKSKYGLIFRSKNDLDNRMVFFDYYQKLKKIVYTLPMNHDNSNTLDLKYITVRAVIKYKITKNDIFNVYPFLIKYYKYILNEIDAVIDLFIKYFPNFVNNTIENKYRFFIIKINNDIKNKKNVNEIFYSNFVNLKNGEDINIYRLILRDFITQNKYINDIYNIIF